MINQLVGDKIGGLAIPAAAPHPAAATGAWGGVGAWSDRLRAGPTVAQMLKRENESFLGWMVGELKAVEKAKPGSWLDLWQEVTGVPAEGGEPVPDVVKGVKSFDEAIKLTEGLTPLYDELAKLTELPPKEFDARYPEFLKKAKAANVLAGAVLPAVDRVMAAKHRAEARLALFKAAIAVVQKGPDAVKET